jgi:predicted component of type VI protein secretion system
MNVLDVVADIVTKLALSVFVAVWMRESGLGPPIHVRANSKPAASGAPPKVLTSQARIGQVRLVTLHTRASLTHWNPSPAGLASQTRTCMGTLRMHGPTPPLPYALTAWVLMKHRAHSVEHFVEARRMTAV